MILIKRILIFLLTFVSVVFLTVFFMYGGVGKRPSEIKAIAHRGYSIGAPENTLPAYKMAKEKGFDYAECDVAFTKDGVAVLLHDSTIDRTSDGVGKIGDLTYEELLKYDFGNWFSTDYKGLKIPTFEEFINLCKDIDLNPYIELKSSGNYSKSQITDLVNIVNELGMQKQSTWISFNYKFLEYIKEVDEQARLGYLSSKFNDELIEKAKNLRTGKNEVFLDLGFSNTYSNCIEKCKKENIPIEVWTVNNEVLIHIMHPYISGVTSDKLIADRVLGRKKD